MPIITTCPQQTRTEIDPIKGSRFIADLMPVTSDDQAKAHLEMLREEYPDARHHCWAFKLSDGRALSGDDGEPSNSAGPPILRHIEGSGIVDIQVVVVRYFGGTKLGVGGLIRAYGDATAAVLAEAPTIETPTRTTLSFDHTHDLTGIIEGVLNRYDLVDNGTQWGVGVSRSIAVIDEEVEAFIGEMTEVTAGRVIPIIE